MSFQEKSSALMLAVIVVVYGWYFAKILSWALETPVGEIEYQKPMLVTVGALILLAIAGHVAIALAPSYEGDRSDERDKIVDLKGEWIGGFVLGSGVLVGLGLAMGEFEHFWIANTLLAGLVLSEVVTSIAKAVYYRQTF